MFLQEKIVIIKCEYDFIKMILKLWHNLHWASHEHKNSLKRHEPLIQLSYPFFVSTNNMSLVSDQNEIKQWWILNGEYKLLECKDVEIFWFGETCLRLINIKKKNKSLFLLPTKWWVKKHEMQIQTIQILFICRENQGNKELCLSRNVLIRL